MTSSVDSDDAGISGKGKAKHTDGQVRGSHLTQKRAAFDVSIVDPNAASHSESGTVTGACSQSPLFPLVFTGVACRLGSSITKAASSKKSQSPLNPNAGTRSAEKTKTDKYNILCQQRGVDFIPII
jgi:hypothetical protein